MRRIATPGSEMHGVGALPVDVATYEDVVKRYLPRYSAFSFRMLRFATIVQDFILGGYMLWLAVMALVTLFVGLDEGFLKPSWSAMCLSWVIGLVHVIGLKRRRLWAWAFFIGLCVVGTVSTLIVFFEDGAYIPFVGFGLVMWVLKPMYGRAAVTAADLHDEGLARESLTVMRRGSVVETDVSGRSITTP